MNPQNNPGTNPGSFLSPATGNAPGQGSALMRLLQMRQSQGITPASQNPGGIGYVAPAAPPQGNAINPSQISAAGQQPQPQPVQGPAGMGSQAPVPPVNPNVAMDPHGEALQTAMAALSNYIGNHGKSLEAQHDVPRKNAEAKLIAAQAPQAAPVGS